MKKTTTQIIDECFSLILRDLESVDVKTHRKLIKTSYFALYDLGGTFLGLSSEPTAPVNIQYNQMGKYKNTIKREVLLQKDKTLLLIERALRNDVTV